MTEPDLRGLPEDLVAALAHELRSPLAAIVGYAELLQRRDDDATRREAAKQILDAAARIDSTLARLLSQDDSH